MPLHVHLPQSLGSFNSAATVINIVNVINILPVIIRTVSNRYSSRPVCLQFTLTDIGAVNQHGLKEGVTVVFNTVIHYL